MFKKFFESENWELLKYGFGLASKIFLVGTIVSMIFSFFDGSLGDGQIQLFANLSIILICVASVFVFERMKVKMWLRYVVSYSVLLAVMIGFVWLVGRWVGDVLTFASYLESIIFASVIFIIVVMIERLEERVTKKKEDKNG